MSPPCLVMSYKTLVLNHTKMLQDIDHFLSFNVDLNALPAIQSLSKDDSSSPFTLPVYHGELLAKSKFNNDYESLVLARLARDKARIKGRYSRTTTTSSSSSSRTFNKLQPQQDPDPYQAGVFDVLGAYVALFSIGTPPVRSPLLVDTGSDFVWWQCSPCRNCPKRKFPPVYIPEKSSTYYAFHCFKVECNKTYTFVQGCDDYNRCRYEAVYGDNSNSSGILAYEKISPYNNPQLTMMNPFVFGCAEALYGDDEGNEIFSGILGLDQSPPSLIGQLKATNFTLCLPTHDQILGSELRIHYLPPENDPESITVPIVPNSYDTNYFVALNGVAVGGEMVPIPAELFEIRGPEDGGTLFDSGTTITWFPPDAYIMFRDQFREKTRSFFDWARPRDIFDTCYRIPRHSLLGRVASVEFYFKGVGVPYTLQIDQILQLVDRKKRVYCLAFTNHFKNYTILGNWQFQRVGLSFNLAAKTLNINPDFCR